ncbi:fibrocystin-L isoform X1 [Brachionus plicatilis]|uniref:Fibrocystin-L isoform X1 n=1 Tax=Brachionus plicatilis TaxID=10195 RepID=A0A3M7PBF0_BRAPC|nr:fibrocystin-L isoform X1 [Brachionus plicatilis]
MPSSYVRECSIRKSFNRAVNVHGTHYVKVSRNFIYDIMGGAYFLEDSVEIGNEFSYNLAIFVKTSSSLLNEDSTPAAYWVTNPNNTVIHNSVAGGTHFGFWYRLLDRPDGPSFDQNYCPKKIPLGRFFNNTIHSSGRIGSEWSHVGIETKNNVYHNHFSKNIQPLIATFYNENTGPAILNSIIIGNSDNLDTKSLTESGIVLAWDRGQLIKNVTFINFPSDKSHCMRGPEIHGTCFNNLSQEKKSKVFGFSWLEKKLNIEYRIIQILEDQRFE